MIQSAIFDIDGTLINSVDEHAKSWQEAFRRHGVNVDFPDVRKQIGKGADQLMPVFLSPDKLKSDGEAIKEDRAAIFKEQYLPHIRPFPKIRELFERVKKDNIALALATSATGDELDAYKSLLGVCDLLEAETTGDDVTRSKPHPDVFQATLETLGNPAPANVLVVGDTPYDVIAANKAGLATIALLGGGFPEAELWAAGAVAIYRDPADLLANFAISPFTKRNR